MPWREDAQAALPRRHSREPESLRRDILDELADHLAEAVQRERDAGAEGETAAWQRALTAFGDPAAVARRLWWDAMKETIMRDWIQTALLGVLVLAVVLAMGMVYRQSQLQMALLASLTNSQSSPVGNFRPMEIRVTRGTEDGPPVDAEVSVSGKLLNENEHARLTGRTGSDGVYLTEPLRPGSHEVWIHDDQGTGLFSSPERTLVFPGASPHIHRITAPDAPLTDVQFQVRAPDTLRNHGDNVFVNFHYEVSVGWYWRRAMLIKPGGSALALFEASFGSGTISRSSSARPARTRMSVRVIPESDDWQSLWRVPSPERIGLADSFVYFRHSASDDYYRVTVGKVDALPDENGQYTVVIHLDEADALALASELAELDAK